MMQSSSEPLKKMIVNRRDCIQIEAMQVLFLFKSSYKLVRNVTFKARANVRNIVGQQDATLLGATCCERLHTMLCVVACCCDLHMMHMHMMQFH